MLFRSAVDALEKTREEGGNVFEAEPALSEVFALIRTLPGCGSLTPGEVEIGSVIYANRPGDGSAREQAASCQRVIGGLANIVQDYATKRYRSNVINWGMLPFHLKGSPDDIDVGDYIFVPEIRARLDGDLSSIPAWIVKNGALKQIELFIRDMTSEEREIVKAGCLINFNRNKTK